MLSADYICKNSFYQDQAGQNVVCLFHLQTVWTQIRPNKLSSDDHLLNSLDTDQARQMCCQLITFANN